MYRCLDIHGACSIMRLSFIRSEENVMELSEVTKALFTEVADCHETIKEQRELILELQIENEMLGGQIYELEEQITGRILSGETNE